MTLNPSDPPSVDLGTFPDPKRLVDLTHPLDPAVLSWPGEGGFDQSPETDVPIDAELHVRSNRFSTGEHVGTHIDASRHMKPRGTTIDQTPLSQLIGRGFRIDVSRDRAGERDFQIPIPLLLRWEHAQGEIPPRSIVLLHTGYGSFWGNREAYLGTTDAGPAGDKDLHFPGLHPESARWLVEERHVKAVGIDTHGIDCGASTSYASHNILLSANIPILENLANLDRLPDDGFVIVALPLPIREGTGAPARVIAILDSPPDSRD
jgi:kynurenine formamidase